MTSFSPPPPPPPHAVAANGSAMASAMAPMTRTFRDGMGSVPFAGGVVGSMTENLAEKVFRAIGPRVLEELDGFGVLDDCTVRHEHDAVRGASGETHFMRDDQHGHPVLREP